MKQVRVHRVFKIRVGNDPTPVVLQPGDQQVDDYVAQKAVDAGAAEFKRGRPAAKRETTAIDPPEVETTKRTTSTRKRTSHKTQAKG